MLLDPKYSSVKRCVSERRKDDTPSPDISANLKQLAEKRTDIFGYDDTLSEKYTSPKSM